MATDTASIPDMELVRLVEENIKKLQHVAEEREHCMFTMKEEVVGLLEKLEIDLNTTALADIFVEEDQDFDSLKQSDLELVQLTTKELRSQVSARRTEVKEMVEQVTALYERLAVPQMERCPLSTGRVCALEELAKSENVAMIKEELVRLQRLQAENMAEILAKSKVELEAVWDECMVGPRTRRQFDEGSRGDLDLELNRIEEEIGRTLESKNRNREVYNKLRKFLNRCELAKDLQMRLQDPERLFKSRGLAMAKEENDRKMVNTLPGLKEDLLEYARTVDDLVVYDVSLSRLVDENTRVLEQMYESSLSTTAPSKSKSRAVAPKTNQSAASPRSLRRQGRLVTSPGMRRVVTRSNSVLATSASRMAGLATSASRMTGSATSASRMTGSAATMRGSARNVDLRPRPQSPVSRPRPGMSKSSTVSSLPNSRPRPHDLAPRVLIQDASSIDEEAFKSNIPYNSTLMVSSPLLAVQELSLAQEKVELSMAELRVAQQRVIQSGARNGPPQVEVKFKVSRDVATSYDGHS